MMNQIISDILQSRGFRRGLIVGVILIVVIFVARYGVLTVEMGSVSNNKDAIVEVFGPSTKYYTQKQNSTKHLLVKRGEYSVKATSDMGVSGSKTNLGILGYKKVQIQVDSPKMTERLGHIEAGCAIPSTSYTMFYNCGISDNLVVTTADGQKYNYNFSPNDARDYSIITAPYMSGFLNFRKNNSQLSVYRVVIEGNGFTNAGNSSVPLEAPLQPGLVSTDSSNALSTKFIVLDSSKRQLSIYKHLGDGTPLTVNLSDKFDQQDSNNLVAKLYGDKVVAYNYFVTDEGVVTAPKGAKQKVYVFDSNNGNVLESYSIDRTVDITNITISKSGDILVESSSVNQDSQTLNTISELNGNKLKKLELYGSSVSYPCWKNSSSFYYIADGNQIFVYDLNQKLSKLAYSQPDSSIPSLKCYNGKVSYSLVAPLTDRSTGLDFYSLSDTAQTGKRLEDLLPLSPGALRDINSAISYKNNVYVDLVRSDELIPDLTEEQYEKLVPANAVEHKKNAIEYFKRQGVDVSKYNFIFNY